MAISTETLAFTFGLLGNIIAFMTLLAPVPTFYAIYKKKTSEGFQSIPYSVALFSSALLLYYGFLKTNADLIVSMNAIGCAIELIYLSMYVIYAPKKAKIFTVSYILLFNVGGLGLVVLFSLLLVEGHNRVALVGWIHVAFSLAVFAAPLGIMREVIRTKSVEYMPFCLSLFLTLCATTWLLYGIFLKDFYIAAPNVLGFLFGMVQMILYLIYKNPNKGNELNLKEKNIEGKLTSEKAAGVDPNDDFKIKVIVCENTIKQTGN